jgi:hypothetical protein
MMATDEDEELLLKTYGKTSWELAAEAERGYDLTKIKHEFTGRDQRSPCRVCSGPKNSWPHLAREITNPELFDTSRDDENY